MPQPIDAPLPQSEHARDLQSRLYREIGISAVAAALRCTVQPEPAAPARSRETSVAPHSPPKTLAA